MEKKIKRYIKPLIINGVKVNVELRENQLEDILEVLESSIRIKDKNLEPISIKTIFL